MLSANQRTREALAAAKERGVKLGGLRASGAEARDAARERAEALRPVLVELAGMSARATAAELNARAIGTPTGALWSAKTVIRLRERLNLMA